MANKLMIYEVEDLETNQIYEIEGPEGLDENTLNEFVAQQKSAQPSQETPAPAPVEAPQVVQTTRPLPRVGVTGQAPKSGPQGTVQAVQTSDAPAFAPQWASPEEEAQIAEAIADPSLSDDQVNALIGDLSQAKGMPRMSMAPGQSEQRQQYIKYLQENQQAPVFGGYTDWKNTLPTPGDTLSENTGVFSEILRGSQQALQGAGLGILGRTFSDWADVGSEVINFEFPDATPEQKEALRDEYVAWLQKGVRAANEQGVKNDRLIPWLIGQLLTPDPVDLIPLGKAAKAATTAGKIGEKLVEGAAVNLSADSVYQALDIYDGVQEKFNPYQSAAALGFGAALHGTVEGVAAGVKRIQSRGAAEPDPVEVVKDTFVTAPVVADKRTKAYKQQIAEATDQIVQKIGYVTQGWENVPQYEVHTNFKKMKGVPSDAVAFVSPEGKVLVNTENVIKQAQRMKVSPDDVVSAMTYHEMLGHYGLSQQFGDELDNFLLRIYEEGVDGLKARVDEWLASNPNAYKTSANRLERAVEEVLAEQSEAGRIKPGILDRATNFIKDFARKIGVDLKFSEREVKTILGMAHNAVVNGKGRDVAGNGFKFMRVYHGSGADFDKFDSNYMGTGEGAQAFGWGHYFSESEGVAKGYRDALAGRSRLQLTLPNGEKASIDQFSPKKIEELLDLPVNDAARTYPVQHAVANIMQRGMSVKDAINDAFYNYSHYADQEGVAEGLAKLEASAPEVFSKGKFYEVEIPDDGVWLDWYKPLKEQSKEVQDAVADIPKVTPEQVKALRDELKELGKEMDVLFDMADKHSGGFGLNMRLASDGKFDTLDELYEAIEEIDAKRQEIREKITSPFYEDAAGGEIYKALEDRLGSAKAVSQFLSEKGVTGTRYPVGSLTRRADGSKTSKNNYVLYKDEDPQIVNKYMRLKREPSEDLQMDVARKVLSEALDNYEPEYRSWKEARRAAKDRGLTAKQINSSKAISELDKRLFQYDAVMQATQDKLLNLTYKMEMGDFTLKDKEDYIRTTLVFNELAAKVMGDQAEVGRALNAIKALEFTKRRITNINEALAEVKGNNVSGFADEQVFNQFAQTMKTMLLAGNQKGAQNLMKQVIKPYWWQYILSFRHSMMLSGLGTHAKNATDNALMIARELEESAVALPGYFIRKGINKAGGNVKEGVSPQEVAARMYGLLRALGDAGTYRETYNTFRTGHANHPVSSKIDMEEARIPGISKVGDALFAADTFFRAFHTNANLYSLGVRKAREKGFTGMSAFEEGANIAHNPTPELLAEAERLTDIALLVDTPSYPSSKLEALKAVRPGMTSGAQATAFLANLMFPFFRVTDRLIFQKLRRSPLAFLDRVTREDLAAGGARMDIALARIMYGSALLTYYWQAAGEGLIEGAAPEDYDKQKSLEATGYLPNSIQEGDKAVDASALNLALNPFDLQNAVAANVASIRKQWEQGEDVSGSLGLAFLSLGNVLASSSFAENISLYLEPFKDGVVDNKETAAANLVGSVASQFVPAALRQYNAMIADPNKRDTSGDKSFGDRVYGRVASGVPGLSDDLPQRYDLLGDPMIQGKSLLGMDNYQPLKNDPVANEIRRLDKGTDKAVLDGAPSSFIYEGQTYKLDAELKQEWQRIMGGFMRMGMKDMLNDVEYRAATDDEKRKMIKDMKTEAYDATKEMLLPYIVGETE